MTCKTYGKDCIIPNNKLIDFVGEWKNNHFSVSIHNICVLVFCVFFFKTKARHAGLIYVGALF
jgi:hypothetical protein